MDSAKLFALRDSLHDRNTTAFIVARDGKIILEWPSEQSGELRGSASTAKGLIGSVALMLLAADGLLDLDDPVSRFVPEWADGTPEGEITIRHLATHTAGIPHDAKEQEPHPWLHKFWQHDPTAIRRIIDSPDLQFTPGSRYEYSGPGYAVLSYIAALGATSRNNNYQTLGDFLQDRFMSPIGVPPSAWSLSYGMTFPTRSIEVQGFWGGGAFTPRAALRVGQVLLEGGRWQDQQLVPTGVVRRFVYHADIPELSSNAIRPQPSIGWWSGFSGIAPSVPGDAFAAIGAGHRIVLAVPSLRLVAVRFGGAFHGEEWGTESFWRALGADFLQPLMETVVEPAAISIRHDASGGTLGTGDKRGYSIPAPGGEV